MITLENCRLKYANENLSITTKFYLDIQFEQKINSPCEQTCLHSNLYHCSSINKTCQCLLKEFQTSIYPELCIDRQSISNCSYSPERCLRLSSSHNQFVVIFLLASLLIISFVIIIILMICLVKFYRHRWPWPKQLRLITICCRLILSKRSEKKIEFSFSFENFK